MTTTQNDIDNDLCIKMAKVEVKIENIEKTISNVDNTLLKQNFKLDKMIENFNQALDQKADKDFVWKVVGMIGGIVTIIFIVLTYLK